MTIYNCVPSFVKLVPNLPAAAQELLPAGSSWAAQLVMSSEWFKEDTEDWMHCAELDREAETVAAATGIMNPNNIMIECLVGLAGQPVVKRPGSKLVVAGVLLLPNDLALHYRSDSPAQPTLQWRTPAIDYRTLRGSKVIRRTCPAANGGRILWTMETPQLLSISATAPTTNESLTLATVAA